MEETSFYIRQFIGRSKEIGEDLFQNPKIHECLEGVVNGLSMGMDPIGIVYNRIGSNFSKNEYYVNLGYRGLKDDIRISPYTFSINRNSKTYISAKVLGAAAGLASQSYWLAPQIMMLITNYTFFKLKK